MASPILARWGLFLLFLQPTQLTGYNTFDPVKDSPPIIKQTDWRPAKSLTLTLSEFKFAPNVLSLIRGKPYRLRIKNIGKTTHFFHATRFFKAIATWKIELKSGMVIQAPYFQSFELPPEDQIDLYFVPHGFGTYEFQCQMTGHLKRGMKGIFLVQ